MGPPHHQFMEPPDEKGQAAIVQPAARRLRKKPGVLVVDDDHLVRILVQLGLERKGFEVWLAPNGREAIEWYREHREDIAVVLLDVCMPGLDGPQTLDALRELNPEVLVCLMSGSTGAYGPEELRQRGAAQVIAKPFFLDDLAHVLRLVAHGVNADLLSAGRIGHG
jgi:CheY-like chemotaxis protein